MTLSDRYRAHRDDPYRGYYSGHGVWRTRVAVVLPVTVVLALVLSMAFAAVKPAKQPARAAHISSLGYQSLLVPSDAAAPTFDLGGTQQAQSAQRVVMSYNAHAGAPADVAGPRTRAVAGRDEGSYRTDANGYRVAPAEDAAMVPARTVVAHLEHSTKGYPAANSFSSNRKVPGSWYGYPSILPVIDSTADRVKVMLAQRPDESTSWIKRSAVVLSRIHYAVVVDISQHWLYVFYKGVEISSFPVGTGASGTPTPTGNYFIAFHAPPNGPGYGSVMLETSAHSRVIAHFEGGDDAIIAIHGPVGSDSQIGDHGAAISNGCIRMHNNDLKQVRHVRNGSPVFLTY
jgi:lipoprotein-anchoring transpeptidase ErfK/SrfK